jgi:hypothetical protein
LHYGRFGTFNAGLMLDEQLNQEMHSMRYLVCALLRF